MEYAHVKLSSNTGEVTCVGGEFVFEVADNTGGTLNATNAACKGTVRVPSGSKKGVVVVNAAVKIEYLVAPPPTPPPPYFVAKAPPGKKAKIAVEVKVTLGGYTVETFGAAEKTSFKAGIAKSAKTTADKVTITKVTAGSRRHLLAGSIAVDFQIETKDAAAAVSVEESIKKADLKKELTSSGLTKVESVSAPVVEVETIFVDKTVVDSAASRVWVSLASILAGAAILALW
jgi:hypothetical protein